ncbi:TetR family transcriptional regulator C-terminal domain-containing protein [Mangrovimonas sp. DI 80]|uniref:TetR family transcriptional regulator C-terminal domain-containing protein n=1 Tax=Mangrovimonas sp. DI 80 TaxID=1779330 RepID=UPI000978A9C4|nr:TetR family transcriptional regulator C-terminal domain-containing protein [Mangrovimonas sp. DI 80]OMP29921.1 heat-shock protein [Mangrovimonas sp. DI 80]
MAKKKTPKKMDLVDLYMDYVLEHNAPPKSVYQFSKLNSFEESTFYEHFSSFDAIEAYVFKAFFEHTIKTLHNSAEYETYDAKNKLLSFYFTFFENLTANRSFVMYVLEKYKANLKQLKHLQPLKEVFTHYIDELDIQKPDMVKGQLLKIQNKAMKEGAWVQLLLTLKFWMEDTSASFSKTDIYIEKSINTSFDIIDTTPINSLMDFGKFIFKERFQTK